MTDALPPIKSFLPTSLIEWEGKISCAVFLPGCNFRCPFCHAASLVLHHDQLETIPFQTVADHLAENQGWIDGAVVSGGEATLHPACRRSSPPCGNTSPRSNSTPTARTPPSSSPWWPMA